MVIPLKREGERYLNTSIKFYIIGKLWYFFQDYLIRCKTWKKKLLNLFHIRYRLRNRYHHTQERKVAHCWARIHQIWTKHCLQEGEFLLHIDYLPSKICHPLDLWVDCLLYFLQMKGYLKLSVMKIKLVFLAFYCRKIILHQI